MGDKAYNDDEFDIIMSATNQADIIEEQAKFNIICIGHNDTEWISRIALFPERKQQLLQALASEEDEIYATQIMNSLSQEAKNLLFAMLLSEKTHNDDRNITSYIVHDADEIINNAKKNANRMVMEAINKKDPNFKKTMKDMLMNG